MDVSVWVGVAIVGIAIWVGRKYGAKAERKFLRLVGSVVLGTIALLLVVGLIWSIAGGDGGSESERDCKRLAETAQKFSTFLKGSDLYAEEFQLEFAVFSFLTMVGPVPDEIRDDLQVLDDAYFEYVDALAGVDPANLDRELQKQLTAEIDLQKVTQASQNIVAWVRARS